MDSNIGVGILVGLIIGSSTYVWNNDSFNKLQKTVLLLCFIFPPAQWLGIIAVLIYNNYKENNSSEKKVERKREEVKTNLNASIDSLTDLKEKGILTNEEYIEKVAKVEYEKTEQDLKNSTEYKQLISLLESGILTKEEFDVKIKLITSITDKKIDKKNIKSILNSANNTYLNNLSNERTPFEVYNKNIELKNGKTLIIFDIPQNSHKFIGCKVTLDNKEVSNDVFISFNYLYEVKNSIIVEYYKPNDSVLINGRLCTIYCKLEQHMKGDFIYYDDNSPLPDGNYKINSFYKFKIVNNRIT